MEIFLASLNYALSGPYVIDIVKKIAEETDMTVIMQLAEEMISRFKTFLDIKDILLMVRFKGTE